MTTPTPLDLDVLAEAYRAEPHGSCNVGLYLDSQWRNRAHWHVIWPDGETWCYESERDARDRVAELKRLAHARARALRAALAPTPGAEQEGQG